MTDIARIAAGHPLDECDCGDYRRDHIDGTGRCTMPDNLSHGFKPCLKFRLSRDYLKEQPQCK